MKVGDEVVCVYKGEWRGFDGTIGPGPKYNEIVHIIGMHRFLGQDFLELEEYNLGPRAGHLASLFRPVMPTDDLVEQIEEALGELITK